MPTLVNNLRAIRGPVTAVPMVAGKGVRIVPDVENNRFVVEADETVLWEGAYSSATTSITLSESLANFERIKVLWQHSADSTPRRVWQEYPSDTIELFCTLGRADSASGRILFEAWWTNNTTSLSKKFCRWNFLYDGNAQTTWNDANELVPIKVVGINRIANN
jgi:hypothetical protein